MGCGGSKNVDAPVDLTGVKIVHEEQPHVAPSAAEMAARVAQLEAEMARRDAEEQLRTKREAEARARREVEEAAKREEVKAALAEAAAMQEQAARIIFTIWRREPVTCRQ